VGDNALVRGSAQVGGNALVGGNAQVGGNALITKTPTCATRSDGCTFTLLPCRDGVFRISAGCRYFTFDEAVTHWTATCGGTSLGEESLLIVEFFKNISKLG
jgi:hypothetical protein